MSRQPIRLLATLLPILGLSLLLPVMGDQAARAQDEAAGAAVDTPADTTDDPTLVTYPENEEPNEVPGDNSIKPRPISPARKQALQRRAGEQVAGTPRGRAVVLGMHIQEVDNERARVVEVAPASPAFDAGIKKGDEIVSFDGFKATKYREWIDGMRRLTTNVPDGETMPIVLVRDGKRLNLRLRVPIAKAGVPPAADDITLNQPGVPNQPVPAPVIAGQQRPGVGGVGYGGDTLIANDLGDDFNNPTGDNAGRAIAELFRLNVPGQPEPVPAAASPAGPAQANPRKRDQLIRAANGSADAGVRVGIAGFRNDANGMFVLLDVGGLQPGNYLVGIDDPSVLASGGNVNGTSRSVTPQNPRAATRRARTETAPAAPVPPNFVPRRETPAPRPGTAPTRQQPGSVEQPANPAGQSNSPQSRIEAPIQSVKVPHTVLAQVAEPPASAGAAVPGDSAPSVAPANDAPNTPTQQATPPATENVQTVRPPAAGQLPAQNTTPTQALGVAEAGNGPVLQIGAFTVDQSGAGRLQQVVESVAVQDVVGQAIVIYAQNAVQQAPTPADPNASSSPAVGAVRQPVTGGPGRGASRPAESAEPAQTGSLQTPPLTAAPANTAANGSVGNRPIAGGLIRMFPDVQPATAGDAATQSSPALPSPNNTQSAPQNSAVPPGAGQPTIR